MAIEVGRWQAAFAKDGLARGERVGIMLKNCREWVVFDQAALGLGLISVPFYTDDRPDNVAYIVEDTDVKLLLIEGNRQWYQLQQASGGFSQLQRLVSIHPVEEDGDDTPTDPRLVSLNDWLFGLSGEVHIEDMKSDDLATIVYTSGTTGRPKGVMLSHRNILANAYAASQCAETTEEEVFLSFLPLSHMLERTAGYYLPMMIGGLVVFARSVNQLAEDLIQVRPTLLISVPRIYERVYAKILEGLEEKGRLSRMLFELTVEIGWHHFEFQQGRRSWGPKLLLWPVLKVLVADKIVNRLGGRIKYAICGGAALPPKVGRMFLSLGLPIVHGYGMTEASPDVTVNRPENNIPESIGTPMPGVEVKIGENEELLIRGELVMLGYWNNDETTKDAIDSEGWLHTGDKARIDENKHLYITGRIKEIIVLANGEKVPPADMEMAICSDPLFEQVMVIGEARPYLAAIIVLNPEQWTKLASKLGLNADSENPLRDNHLHKYLLTRIKHCIKDFPGYARIRKLLLTLNPWNVDNGMLTPTLKIKRTPIMQHFQQEIEDMYQEG